MAKYLPVFKEFWKETRGRDELACVIHAISGKFQKVPLAVLWGLSLDPNAISIRKWNGAQWAFGAMNPFLSYRESDRG